MQNKATLFVSTLLLGLFILNPDPVKAQDTPHDFTQTYVYEIGAAAGFSTGYGLSFRYWPKKYGIQVNFAPYYDEYGSMISLGATGLMQVEDNGWSRFFFYLGNHLHYNKTFADDYLPEDQTILTWIVGAGPGLELLIKERVGINVMFGVASYLDTDEYWMLSLTGETGLYYRF